MKASKTRKLKYVLVTVSLFLCIFAAVTLVSSCLNAEKTLKADLTPGVYEGSGSGYRGMIRVQIVISPAGIEDIVILSHGEGIFPGKAAMEELLDLVLETGSTDLDAVSGATFSSAGFLEAVEDALARAR